MTVEEQIDKTIQNANFDFLEIEGFKKQPMLAVKVGIAMGYRMALEETVHFFKKEE